LFKAHPEQLSIRAETPDSGSAAVAEAIRRVATKKMIVRIMMLMISSRNSTGHTKGELNKEDYNYY
jgi:hypothetical protein